MVDACFNVREKLETFLLTLSENVLRIVNILA